MNNFHEFKQTHSLEQTLSQKIATQLQEAIDKKGYASLVVSGGRTPIQLFEQLSSQPIAWEHVWVTLADERWVDASHSDSNSALVLKHLQKNDASTCNFFEMYRHGEPANILSDLENSLPQQHLPFDVVVLGMGLDGHTASWFPCSAELSTTLASSHNLAFVQPESASHLRLTFTPRALLNSKQIYVHLVGDEKRKVYEQACENNDVTQMPIRVVLHQHDVPVDVYWSV